MSTKNSSSRKSGINWPKTEAAKAAQLEQSQHAIAAVAKMGQIMTAASAVPMPRSRKLLTDAAQAATKGVVGGRLVGKKKKRAWQEHAEEYFSTNNAWDEVNGIYQSCLDLLRTSLALTPMLRERALLTLVRDKKLLTRNVTAITRDTQVLSAELMKIRETHKDKQGGSKDQMEMMESCNVFSQYVEFMERYDSALMPIVVHTSEQLQEAMLELEVIDPALAAQLSKDLATILKNIQLIIHDHTGADDAVAPAQPAAEEVPAQAAA